MVILETPRLTLRHLEPGDLDALFAPYRDPEIRRHFPDRTLSLELAYLIDKSRWREGLASEAAQAIVEHARTVLKLRRLICLIMPGNAASAGVARRVGMAFEREHNDHYGSCHIYARLLSA